MRKLFFLLPLVVAACGTDGNGFGPRTVQHVPQIAALNLSPGSAVHMEGDGNVVVSAQVEFSDAGLDIETLWVLMPDGTSLGFNEVVNTETGTLTEEFLMSTEAVGTFALELWLVDEAGDSSSRVTAEFRVVPSTEPDGFPIRITQATDGSPPNGPSVNGGLNWHGDYAIFASKASNLVAGDNNAAYDLFVRKTCVFAHDDCTPATTRAVTGVGGAEPNGDIGWTVTSPNDSLGVSFNARFVAFVSSASNLVPDDTNGVDDVFLVDTCIEGPYGPDPLPCTPDVIRVSVGNDGSQSAMPSSYPAMADDGRYVAFVSADPNLVTGDTNGVADVFLRDTCRGAPAGCTPGTTRVSVATNGGEANAASGEPAFTGRYVAFSSLASNLVAGDPNGVQDVFLRDTCLGEPGCVPSTRLVSVGHLGDPADAASSDPQVSWGLSYWHGRFVVFVSSASNLVPGDTNGASDVFERDLCAAEPDCTPSTARISVSSTGGQIWGDSWGPDFLRWDGETVPFVTAADAVVPGDTNGIADVFVRHHCPLGAPDYCNAFTRRVSTGAGGAQTDGDSYAPRMSHDMFSAWAITFISEASNILPDSVPIPNDGSIYIDLAYE